MEDTGVEGLQTKQVENRSGGRNCVARESKQFYSKHSKSMKESHLKLFKKRPDRSQHRSEEENIRKYMVGEDKERTVSQVMN